MKNKKNYLSSLIYHLSSLRSGFTLIELLVAISIIGILSGILLANFVGARQRARDGVRKSDLRQIQSALELYMLDQGQYPVGAFISAETVLCGGNLSDNAVYMKELPCDPLDVTKYTYTPNVDFTDYDLTACLENENDSQKDTSDVCEDIDRFSYTVNKPY